MPKMFVVSHAAFNNINRNLYIKLQDLGWSIQILVPEKILFSSGEKTAHPRRPQDPEILFVERIGNNPRTYTYKNLIKLLNDFKPDVVFLDNDPVSRLAVIAGLWCKKNSAYLFCQSCENLSIGIIASYKRGGIKSVPAAMVKQVLRFLSVNTVASVFTISAEGTEIFKRLGYKNVLQIPLGFDPEIFYPDHTRRLALRSSLQCESPVFAYFGRLNREKGVHVLLEALSKLKHYDWTFMMDKFDLYSTPYAQHLNKLINEYELAERVKFIDADHYEIAGFMNAADVVVVPSISSPRWIEQYGRVAPEAMACGKIVIVSSSGTLPQLVADCGVIVPEGDVEALKTKLEDFLLHPERFEDFKSLAAKRALNELSLPRQATMIDDHIKRVTAL